jgi:nitrous oxidase accessory protein
MRILRALLLPALALAAAAMPLELLVALTPEGGTLRPPPGTYRGPLEIRKRIVLDGGGETVLDGGGQGTVLSLLAEGAVARGLRIIGSGYSHDRLDAGVRIEGDGARLEDCRLEDVLFGVVLQGSRRATVRAVTVVPRPAPPTLRGEGIRLWNCRDCRIEGNRLQGARDVVFSNSPGNQFLGNLVEDGRIGIELVYSPGCLIAGNTFLRNQHGLIGIYSDSLWIRGNSFLHQDKQRGSALAVKGSSQVRITDNAVLDCAIGLTANAPVFPENILIVTGNLFAYNDAAIYIYGDRGGHILQGNRFDGNFQQVRVTHPSGGIDNDWLGNHWDDYTGFDRDGDGAGDTPYLLHYYSDRIWMERDELRFFRGSPLLSLIDFVERLAPFSAAPLVLRDEAPRMDGP